MSRLYDWQNKEWVDAGDGNVTDMVKSGRYTFEAGMRIPVVSSEGKIGTIPSEEAEKAFSEGGYRWSTYQDSIAHERDANVKLRQERAESALGQATSVVAGGMRGLTYGVSDVVAGAVDPRAKDVLNDLKEFNPIESAVAQGVGAVVSPITKAAGAVAGIAGEAAQPLVGLEGAAPQAASIVSRIGNTALGSSIEGAFFGAGDGISEAGLGKPEDIAENLMAGPMEGAIFGGLFGGGFGAFKEFAPSVKSAISAAAEFGNDAVKTAMQKTLATGSAAVLHLQGEKELASIVKKYGSSEAVREAFYSGGAEAAEKVAVELHAVKAEAKAYATKLKSDFKDAVSKESKATRQSMNEAVEQANGDVVKAKNDAWAAFQSREVAVEEALNAHQTPGTTAVFDRTEDLIKRLERTGDPKAKAFAREIQTYSDSQVAVAKSTVANGGIYTAGKEMLAARQLRQYAFGALETVTENKEARKLVEGYVKSLNTQMHAHPELGATLSHLDGLEHNYKKFVEFVTGSQTGKKVKDGILWQIANDPGKLHDYHSVLGHIAELLPDLQALKGVGSNLVEQGRVLDNIKATLGKYNLRRLGDSDYLAIAKELGDPKYLAKADDIRTTMSALQSNGENVFTQHAALSKLLGKPIDPSLTHYAPFGDDFKHLEKLSRVGGSTQDTISRIVQREGKRFLMRELGGAALGLPGRMLGAAVSAGSDPEVVFKTLTRLEKMSNRSHKVLEKSLNGAVDALTSEKVRQGIVATVATVQPLKDRRQQFETQRQHLISMQDANQRVLDLQKKVPALEGAPNLQAAIAGQYNRAVDFLTEKLPEDPMANQTVSAFKSRWTPTDFELSRFGRYVDAVENPTKVLSAIARGTVTPEEVETLQHVYPQMYKRLQSDVMSAIMERNTDLRYDQRMAIGTLFNLPTDVTLSPQFIMAMQQQFAAPPEQGGRPQGSKSATVDTSANQTDVERMSNK